MSRTPSRRSNEKVALVFGASAGLGSAIAETLAAEGSRIALASRPSDSLTAAAERVGAVTDTREYADVVTFLASPRASYITGSIIRVDGGLIPSI